MATALHAGIKKFWNDEDGLGTLEILLIIAVLVIAAIAFRKWITQWVKNLFTQANDAITTEKSIKEDINEVYTGGGTK